MYTVDVPSLQSN